MYLQEIFEVVIGLVFTWLILSTATMQVLEWFASLLRWRAGELEQAIRQMLGDGGLTRCFYDHPLIRSLSRQEGRKAYKPSYIPADKFSAALLNIIATAHTESGLLLQGLYSLEAKVAQIKPKGERERAHEAFSRLVELARLSTQTEGDQTMSNLILASLEKEITDFGKQFPALEGPVSALIQDARRNKERIDKRLAALPARRENPDLDRVLKGMLALGIVNPELRLTLDSLLMGNGDLPENRPLSVQALQSRIESWFNASMDRLSGWYKRKAQLRAFVIGFVLAALLNIDTVQLSNQLWREPIVRQAITLNLSQLLQQPEAGASSGIGSAILTLQDQLLNVGLPIGWRFEVSRSASCAFVPREGASFGIALNGLCARPFGTGLTTNGWNWLVIKLGGLLISALAAAQGSSFWFDLLMKIVNVRVSGKKPE